MNSPPPSGATDPTPRQHVAPSRAIGRAAVTPSTDLRSLADEFFYLAHDDRTGRPRLYSAAIAHGLAAALLAELYSEGRITIEGRHVRVTNPGPPEDRLQHLVDRLKAEGHTETRTWLAFVATFAYDLVATRMSQLGLVRPRPSGLLRRATLHVPTDTNAAAWPEGRLRLYLSRLMPLEHPDVALANLVLATGLDTRVLQFTPSDAHGFLAQQVTRADLPLRNLFKDLRTAVDSAVLSHRTS